ncbi:MAG TPA: chemotaxis protein CheW [Candidatus Binatia bacterium]|nr:chemotaxis protein CheW [Candidatus Binatia bacterium]
MSDAGDMADVVREFLIESRENLDQLDRDLVALEKNPDSRETLASVFRTIHTIKGTCGFLGFGRLEALTHAGESLLSRLRDGKLRLGPEITTGLLEMVDAVRAMLADIEATGADGEADHAALIERLVRLRADEPAPAPGPKPRETAPPDGAESRAQAAADGTIRVDVGLLDRLMTLVGELVLARNQLLQSGAARPDAAFAAASQRLDLITTELQEGVMKTRMQPIRAVWGRLPRVVRDLAVTCGKQVRMEMEGRDTELDKTVVEAIKDPLIHLVRNAVDHGIEAPAARLAAGKPAEGCLRLRAFHESGLVNLDIADDGAGIDTARIRSEAVERGLVGADEAARLGERELLELIFLPGFSTAEKVTRISGRGVGMDVVRNNIEKIGGTLDVQSEPGRGTTFRIRIPLTLAIVPALIVACDGDRYAIPQGSVRELVRLESGTGRGVELIHGAPVHRLRGALLPLVHLGRELGVAAPAAADLVAARVTDVVVLEAAGRRFGLIVDGVLDPEEIVVKPLGRPLRAVPVFAGATIMGDGRVALILDVLGLAQRAHVVSEVREPTLGEAAAGGAEVADERRDLLVFALGAGGRMAMPLALVARLEEVPRAAVEWVGGRPVVQYRGGILPLVPLAEVFGVPDAATDADPLQVVVHADGERRVGLVVDRILDVVREPARPAGGWARPGTAGSVVIQQRVTELLDLPAVLAREAMA